MKVLVTGASGFLGTYALASLKRHGIEAVAIGRQRPREIEPTAFIAADLLAIRDFSDLVATAGATHLLHLAWYAEHGKYWSSPLNLRWVEATTRLVEAFCHAGGRQVVVAGTCAEYDWSYGYCREDSTPLNPSTLYGIAKDAARRLVTAVCARQEVPCAWGRVFQPYGSGEAGQRLIPSLADVFQGRRPPFGVNAMVYRDFLHASDVAEGIVALLRAGAAGQFNISSGQPVQIEWVVRELAMLLAVDPEPVLALTTERPGEPVLLAGENLKLKALGWQPEYSLGKGLEQTLSNLSQYPRYEKLSRTS